MSAKPSIFSIMQQEEFDMMISGGGTGGASIANNRGDNSDGMEVESKQQYGIVGGYPSGQQINPLTGRGPASFVNKLYGMMQDPSASPYIFWAQNGASFFIKNTPEFQSIILPAYFKHNNIASFVRKLNMYDFHKVNKVPRSIGITSNTASLLEFKHARFLRDRPELLNEIKRKVPETGVAARDGMKASLAGAQPPPELNAQDRVAVELELLYQRLSTASSGNRPPPRIETSNLMFDNPSTVSSVQQEELNVMITDNLSDNRDDMEGGSKQQYDIVSGYPGGQPISPLTGKRPVSFVTMLYGMMQDPSASPYIFWAQNGTSFFIKATPEFQSIILPAHFKHQNIASFVRKLNMYDFHKVNKVPRSIGITSNTASLLEFKHARFLRDRPDLLSEIKRKVTEAAATASS